MGKKRGCLAMVAILLSGLLIHSLAVAYLRAYASASLPSDLAFSPSAGAMLELKALGILTGYRDGTFRPDDLISRAEFCAMVVRALALNGEATNRSYRPPFTDVQAPFAWAFGFINTAADMRIVAGDPDGRFRPGAPITGAEAAAAITRMLGREGAVQSGEVAWPENYLNEAEVLGLWPLVYTENQPLTRGLASEALACALHTVGNLPVGTMTAGVSALTRLGVVEVTGEARGLSAPTQSTPGEILMADGTFGPADGKLDSLELLPNTIVHGVTDLYDLKGRKVHLLVDRDGRTCYVSVTIAGRLASLENLGETYSLTLADGTVYRVAAERCRVTLNHKPAQLAHLKSGMDVVLSFGAAGAVVGVDALAEICGTLTSVAGAYGLTDEVSGALTVIRPAPTTTYTLNGKRVSREQLDAELARAGVSYGIIRWDSASGCIATLEARAYDSASTVHEPVLEIGSRLLDAPAWFTVAGTADVRRSFAATAIVRKDGVLTNPSAIRRGDIVSFRSDAQGNVTYLVALTDTIAPAVALPAQVNAPEQYTFTLNEAIDLSTLELWLDEDQYGPDSTFPNRLSVSYSPETRITTVRVYPYTPLSESTHDLRLTVRDNAGNQCEAEATFSVDTMPMALASVEWGSAVWNAGPEGRQTQVRLYFTGDADDQIDEASAKDLRNWTFTDGNPANGVTRIIACTHAGYYVTLVLDGPVDPGSRLHGEIRDNAGNSVIVDAVYEK